MPFHVRVEGAFVKRVSHSGNGHFQKRQLFHVWRIFFERKTRFCSKNGDNNDLVEVFVCIVNEFLFRSWNATKAEKFVCTHPSLKFLESCDFPAILKNTDEGSL